MLFQVSDLDDQIGIGHDETGKAIRARHQLSIVDCEDANGNTPLSEAASTVLFSKQCMSHSKQKQMIYLRLVISQCGTWHKIEQCPEIVTFVFGLTDQELGSLPQRNADLKDNTSGSTRNV